MTWRISVKNAVIQAHIICQRSNLMKNIIEPSATCYTAFKVIKVKYWNRNFSIAFKFGTEFHDITGDKLQSVYCPSFYYFALFCAVVGDFIFPTTFDNTSFQISTFSVHVISWAWSAVVRIRYNTPTRQSLSSSQTLCFGTLHNKMQFSKKWQTLQDGSCRFQ